MANNYTWDQSLGATHISSALNEYEAARNSFFTLIVDDLESLVTPIYSGENPQSGDLIANAQDTLRLNVVKCPVPHFSVETLEYRRGNEVVKFAGVPTWDGGSIVVDDVIGQDTKSVLVSWLYKAYNPHTRKGGRMKDYKKTCTLVEYTQDYVPIRTWILHGVFITKISEGEFDRENDGKRQITADFSFDRAVMTELTNKEKLR